MNKTKKIQNILLEIMKYFFSLFFIVILFNNIFLNKTISIDYNPIVLLGSILLFYILCMFIYKKYKDGRYKLLKKKISKLKIIIALIIILIIQAFIIYLACAKYSWDCGKLVQNAMSFVQNGEPSDVLYFSRFTNNIEVVIIFKYVLTIANFFVNITEQNSFIILTIFNALIVDISALITFLTIRQILGNIRANFSLIFILPLIIFSPYILLPYTDTITMIFPISLLYIYINIKKNRKIKKALLIILFGFLTIMGSYIKPTVLIMTIAIGIIELLNISNNIKEINFIKLKKHISIILLFFLGIGIGYSIYSCQKNLNFGKFIKDEDYYKNSIPFTHFLMIGMQEDNINNNGKRTYGAYNNNDYIKTLSTSGYKEKQYLNMLVVKDRLNKFGFFGYLKYLYNKANWILSDGTFFYGFEGSWIEGDYFNTSDIARTFQRYIKVGTEEYNNVTANIMEIAWTLILLGLVFSFERKNEINISKLAIIGLVIFILLFEGRARYLVNYIPIFILVGIYGLSNSFKVIDTFFEKK